MNKVTSALGGAAMVTGLLLSSASTAHAAPASPQVKMGIEQVEQANRAEIYRVSCGTRTDYFKTWSPTGNTCWAYAGTKYVTLYDVRKITSGNNAGYVDTTIGLRVYIPKWKTVTFAPGVKIKKIVIY